MADEILLEPTDVPREAREAVAAWARYYANRTPENLQAAIKESADVYRAGKASGWTWQRVGMAVAAAVVAVLLSYGVTTWTVVKDDSAVVKLIGDGINRLDKTMAGVGVEIQSLGKKIDVKPEPIPVTPDSGKPKPLKLPKEIETSVGGKLIKVKAVSVGVVTWIVPPSGDRLDVHAVGDTAILTASADGEYWIGALTVVGGKATEPEWCRIVCGKGPMPPPVPPSPTPVPQDWPTTAPGLRVLIVFEEMERDKLTANQRAIINGAPVRDYLDSVCASDGQWKAWRIWDKDIGLTNAEPHWKAMMNRPRTSVPWVVISNYQKAYHEGPLPASVEEFKTQIQKVQ